jgi:N-methylhydantoinase A
VYIGIDVGGTYTDAVLTDGKKVIQKAKFPTLHENLLESLLQALDIVIKGIDLSLITRVVLSTTLVTNVIAEKKYPPAALVLIPGPGLSHNMYSYNTLTCILKGAVDFRGREITPLDIAEINCAIDKIQLAGYDRVAVVGKFSCRNNSHEITIKKYFAEKAASIRVETGHTVSGQLNYPRRIATTMLTAVTKDIFSDFINSVKKSLRERNISAPAFILKADGGTLPLDAALHNPVETIFSGPAASALGAVSLLPKGKSSVVVDIGGTTSDLALVLSGMPLMASKGAVADGLLTHVKSFAVKSIPLGGDSTVISDNNEITILPMRSGPAYCMGGSQPTLSDAMKFLDKIDIGDMSRAREAISRLAKECGKTPENTAGEIVEKACKIIIDAIEKMFISWEQEPAYRIWEIVKKTEVRPDNIVGVGGASSGLIPDIAKIMGYNPVIPEHAEVANALGAAVAQPTVTVSVRIDTEQGVYSVVEDGSSGSVSKGSLFKEEDAVKLARDLLFLRAESLNIKQYVKKIEVLHCEVFNMVRGWSTTGKIYDICLQTPRNILFYLGQEDALNEQQ